MIIRTAKRLIHNNLVESFMPSILPKTSLEIMVPQPKARPAIEPMAEMIIPVKAAPPNQGGK